MNTYRNKIQLVGRISTPISYELTEGVLFTRFKIATTEKYQNTEGVQCTQMMWHKCLAFDKVATILRDKVKNGDEIAVEGKLLQILTVHNGVNLPETVVYTTDLLILRRDEKN